MEAVSVLEPTTEAAKAYHGPFGCNIFLDQSPMYIGRNPAVQAGNVNLPVHWQQVSAKHCFFTHADGKYFITDTSSNGTYRNGQRLEKNVPCDVSFGDKIGLASPSSKGLYEFVFRQANVHEVAALRLQKERLEKRRPSSALDTGSVLKKSRLGGDESGKPTPLSNAAHSNLATALNDLQKQNQLENVMQAERASRAEEQKKREDAENKLREMELVRAGELQRIEAETTAKFAAERKTWQEQVETVKSENEALQDLLRKKETAIKAAHVFEKVQQEQLDRQTLEIAGLKESLDAASSASEHCKMLLEEERVKYNKLSHQLSLAQHAAEERAAEHIATLGLVENQKQEIARLQSDVLNLQQEVQGKIREVQVAKDAEAETQDLLRVRTAFLTSASSGFVKLAAAVTDQQKLLRRAQQALNAVVSSGLEVQAHQDEVMQIFSVVTPEANEMLNNQSDDDEIVVATKTAEDVSMATQDQDLEEKDHEEGIGTRPEPDGHDSANQVTQTRPSIGLVWTSETAEDGCHNTKEQSAAPQRIEVSPNVKVKGASITLGAQPNSISFMLGQPDASLPRFASTGKRESSHIDPDQASYASSISRSPSGDENTDMNNSLDAFRDIQKSETRKRPASCGATSFGMSLERTAVAETLMDD